MARNYVSRFLLVLLLVFAAVKLMFCKEVSDKYKYKYSYNDVSVMSNSNTENYGYDTSNTDNFGWVGNNKPPAFKKRLDIPQGTLFRLEPTLEFPVWQGSLFSGVRTKFRFQAPIDFEVGSLLPVPMENLWPIQTTTFFDYINANSRSQSPALSSRYKRDIRFNSTKQFCSYGHMDRFNIIRGVEDNLQSIGLGGKSCLLRAICEAHHFDIFKQYGLIGELVETFLSFSNRGTSTTIASCGHADLTEYMKAEKRGRKGTCAKYYNECERSVFK